MSAITFKPHYAQRASRGKCEAFGVNRSFGSRSKRLGVGAWVATFFSVHGGVKRLPEFFLRKVGLCARGITSLLGDLRGRALFLLSNQKRGASRRAAGRRAIDHSAVNKGAPRDISKGAIRFWVVGATGFRQSPLDESGLEVLWREMRSLKEDGVCIVKPYEWNVNAEKEAAFIARNSAPGAVVLMYAYSYGVGNFFTKFARALKRYGIRIARLISVDGIRRWLALKPLSLRWFQDKVSIAIPDNVDVAYGFRQTADRWLRGHRLVAEDPRVDGEGLTTVIDWQLHGCDHLSIDESLTVHHVALTEFRQVIEGGAL